MAHPAGFEPATIRLEGGVAALLDAANYKDFQNPVNIRDTKMTLPAYPKIHFS